MLLSELKTETFTYVDKDFEYFSKNLVTTAPAETAVEYNATVTYVWGDYVKVASIKRKFRVSNIAGVTGKHPVTYLGIDWVDSGAINEYAMFDPTPTSTTRSTVDFSITIDFNTATTATVQKLKNIASIRIIQTDATKSTIYYDSGILTRDISRTSYYEYYTSPLLNLYKKTVANLKWKSSSVIEIQFTVQTGTTAEIGLVATGYAYDIGATLYGSSVGYDDNSVYKTDEFGFTKFDKRVPIDIIDGSLLIEINKIDFALDTLKRVRGKLSQYIGDDREVGKIESLDIVGFAKGIRIPINNPTKNKFPIKIIGG